MFTITSKRIIAATASLMIVGTMASPSFADEPELFDWIYDHASGRTVVQGGDTSNDATLRIGAGSVSAEVFDPFDMTDAS